MDHLKEQTESGRAASEQLADQMKLVQESVVPATVFPS